MKKALSILLAMLMLVPMAAFLPVHAASSLDLRVTPFASDCTEIKAWYNSNDKSYDLFLPADADASALKVRFSGGDTLTVGDRTLRNGDVTDVFAAGGTCSVKVGRNTFTVKCYQSANIPSIYIQTESGSLSYIHANKENKEPGVITTVEDGEIKLDAAVLKQMKGRGNSTWGQAKKPYNIKFDKKTSLLGMPKAKKWTLLASAMDPSLIHNYIALALGTEIGLPYTSEMRYADLYVNGEYLGNYIVVESVEVGSNRVEINDLEDANEDANPNVDIEALSRGGVGGKANGSRKWVNLPNDPENITGGYLMEFDYQTRYDEEASGFKSNAGNSITVKSPEYASKNEVNYIADYYQEFEDAVMSETGTNALGKHYTEYIDLESFAKNYVLQELTFNIDGGQTSFYIYKDADSDKFVAAPIWDFDYSLGQFGQVKVEIDTTDPTLWFVNMLYYIRNDEGNADQTICDTPLRMLFMRQADFRSAAAEQWTAITDLAQTLLPDFARMGQDLTASAVMNALRWGTFGKSTDVNKLANSYAAECSKSVSFLTTRAAALTPGFSENRAFLYYDANGGTGRRVEAKVHVLGDSVKVKDKGSGRFQVLAPYQFDTLKNWNTRPDGTGTSYAPGDTIVLTQECTVLYAQYREMKTTEKADEHVRSFWKKIEDFFVRLWEKIVSIFK